MNSNLINLSQYRLARKMEEQTMNQAIVLGSPQSQLIYRKMIDIMQEIGPIGKDQNNKIQGFKFRGIDQFINALHPALAKHRVFMVPKCVSESHEIREVIRSTGKEGLDKHVHVQMEYAFFAEDGSSVVIGPIAAEGLDSGDKATSKALSAALKYTLIQTFCIATEDMSEGDLESPIIEPGALGAEGSKPDQIRVITPLASSQKGQSVAAQGAGAQYITDKQRTFMFALLNDCHTTEEQLRTFCKEKLHVDSTKNIPMRSFDNLITALKSGYVNGTQHPNAPEIYFPEEKNQWLKNRAVHSDPMLVK